MARIKNTTLKRSGHRYKSRKLLNNKICIYKIIDIGTSSHVHLVPVFEQEAPEMPVAPEVPVAPVAPEAPDYEIIDIINPIIPDELSEHSINIFKIECFI